MHENVTYSEILHVTCTFLIFTLIPPHPFPGTRTQTVATEQQTSLIVVKMAKHKRSVLFQVCTNALIKIVSNLHRCKFPEKK